MCKQNSKKGICPGIINFGSTCFLNALLQFLSPCASINRCFEVMVRNGQNLKCSLSFNLYSAFKVLNNEKSEQDDHYNPKEVLNSLYTKGWSFPTGEQDAYELFTILMEILHEENPEVSAIISLFDGKSLMHNSYLIENEGVNKFKTSLPKMLTKCLRLPFQGKMENQLICKKCCHRFPVKYDSFDSLSIPIDSKNSITGNVSLQGLLKQYFRSESIEGMLCESCNTRSDFLKKMKIGTLPSTLCIHLQRTAWMACGPVKREDQVLFPDFLDMTDCTNYSQPQKFSLLSAFVLQAKDKQKLLNGMSSCDLKMENTDDEVKNKETKINKSNIIGLQYSSSINMLKALNYYHHAAVSGLQSVSKQSNKTEESEALSDLEYLVGAYKRDTFLNRTNKTYRLVSVIVHLGNTSSGHFVTYKRCPSRFGVRYPSKWIFTSDTFVRPATVREVFSSRAYMLLYEKL